MAIHIPHINAIDPSRTLTLRNRWVSDFKRRFRLLLNDITEAIVELDVLGLEDNTEVTNITNVADLRPKQFAFERDAQKIDSFMDWVEQKTEEHILSGGTSGFQLFGDVSKLSSENNWMNTYIDSAYQQGIRRSRQELKNIGVNVNDYAPSGLDDPIQMAFNSPVHINRVGLIYTRNFTTLKAITAAMDSTISDVLAVGMAEGKHPRQIAAAIKKSVTGKGNDFGITDSLGRYIPAERRAMILARTETIRAHHSANIGEYKAAGILGIKIQVEHLTAGDSRVCPRCEPLEEKIYTIEEAETAIPVHPQCRCVALPHLPDDM